ncbi:MAG: TetR family transcriptional regulator [Pseudomonadales bacterium]|nr:TetR/AcrR family transcriptional regulator [Pseudomonadales bacterium]NIX09122.1 TetR family transcriptional regulator [Pseudomonadales bacterium]
MNAHTKSVTYTRAPEEKRERLLAAARELFAEQGFDHTSTQQIAGAAGVSEGILFHHFGSKRGLLERIAEDFVAAGVQAAMPASAAQLSEEAVVRGAFDFADAHPTLYRLLEQMSAELGDPGGASRSAVIVAAIETNLEQGMSQGIVRDGDARIMAQLQFALVDAAYKAWRDGGDPERREDYIREAVRCMKAMLAPTGAEDRPPLAEASKHRRGDTK